MLELIPNQQVARSNPQAVAKVREAEYRRSREESSFDNDGMLNDTRPLPPVNNDGAELYLRRYLDFFPTSGLVGKRIVVFEHSAVGRDLLVEILTRLGARVVPTGRSEAFIPIDTEDITAERLAELQEMADAEADGTDGPDAIVSTDGDSDRPLVAGVDVSGPPTFGTAVTLPIAGDSTRRGPGASFSSDRWVRHE